MNHTGLSRRDPAGKRTSFGEPARDAGPQASGSWLGSSGAVTSATVP
jgi:hypothetical protein